MYYKEITEKAQQRGLPAAGRRRRPDGGERGVRKADHGRDEIVDDAGDVGTGGVTGKPTPIHLQDSGTDCEVVSPGEGQEGEGDKEVIPASEPRHLQRTGLNPGNSVIKETDNIGGGTRGQKIDANLAAIRLVKQLDQENRYPTKEEQAVLAKYVSVNLPRVRRPRTGNDHVIEPGLAPLNTQHHPSLSGFVFSREL